MTLGEKIASERRKLNYTQEQLAQLLGVSRQSVSKWESDLAYPETEKLIQLGKLFDCSMDYLLREEITEKDYSTPPPPAPQGHVFLTLRERKSNRLICGLPLYHIARNANGFFAIGIRARGVFAIGLQARGICSLGLLSMGYLSFGLLSLGLLSFGNFSLGLIAIGAVALGIFAFGAVALGILSVGALSVGCFSLGAHAIGYYGAIGDVARGMVTIGESISAGTHYAQLSPIKEADYPLFRQALDLVVPPWLSVFKSLFTFFL